MATVAKPRTERKNAANEATTNFIALNAQIWASLGKLAEDQLKQCRDDLPEGSESDVELTIDARLDDVRYRQDFDAHLSVGHGSTRATSTTPHNEIVAWILGFVNAKTRESILRTLPEVFDAHEGQLPVTDDHKDAAKSMLQRLRQKKEQSVRGTVRVKYDAAKPGFKVVG